MKKLLIMMVAILACSTTLVFAGSKHEKGAPSPKSEHEITVGNEKAISGSTADDKSLKAEKSHTNKGKSKKN